MARKTGPMVSRKVRRDRPDPCGDMRRALADLEEEVERKQDRLDRLMAQIAESTDPEEIQQLTVSAAELRGEIDSDLIDIGGLRIDILWFCTD